MAILKTYHRLMKIFRVCFFFFFVLKVNMRQLLTIVGIWFYIIIIGNMHQLLSSPRDNSRSIIRDNGKSMVLYNFNRKHSPAVVIRS